MLPGPRRVLLGVGGGIAAVKAPELVRRLRERGCEVRCALTRAGASFVAPLALEVLTGHRVYDESYLTAGGAPEEAHLAAGEWAELLLIAPATAHLIARLALGLADDFLTTTALASPRPLLLVPAMHARMWEHPATRGHVATLAARGVRFLGPVVGPLASGEVAVGRMAEPEEIVEAVLAGQGTVGAPAAGAMWHGLRVLVSAGPTWEPLDPVRFIANRSSGKMGFALAAEAARRGATVELVAGPVALPTPPGVLRTDVETAQAMREVLLRRVGDADLVLMAAAVADYRPRLAASRKLSKEEGVPRLELVENPDILAELAAQPGRRVVVGFAAETSELPARAAAKLRRKGVEYLVANDVSRSDIGFGSDWNEVTVFRRDGEPLQLARQPKPQLASALLDVFAPALFQPSTRREEAPFGGAHAVSANLAPVLEYLQAIGWEELYLPTGANARAAAVASPAGGRRHPEPTREAGPVVEGASRVASQPHAGPDPPEGERAAELLRVAAEAAACTRCKLAAGRHSVVFGSGDPDAGLMFIGEGPGAEEDRQGLPFVGPAGQLLTRIIAAIGLTREQVYIANVVKCRPPGNRDPQPDEVAACRGYLESQVRLVRPRVIVALGRVAAQTVLGNELPVGRLRGDWHQMLGVPLRVTYHPAAILRNAAYKRPTWEDMQLVRARLDG